MMKHAPGWVLIQQTTAPKIKVKSRSKQYVLCSTSSSEPSAETMIEGQYQMVEWYVLSTK